MPGDRGAGGLIAMVWASVTGGQLGKINALQRPCDLSQGRSAPVHFRQPAPTTSAHIAALFNRKRGWRNIAIAPGVEAEVKG